MDERVERRRRTDEVLRGALESEQAAKRLAARILGDAYPDDDMSPPVALAAVGVPVRVHDRHGDDLGLVHVPPPVVVGDVLELGRGPLLPLRIVDVVETTPHSQVVALVKVAPAILR